MHQLEQATTQTSQIPAIAATSYTEVINQLVTQEMETLITLQSRLESLRTKLLGPYPSIGESDKADKPIQHGELQQIKQTLLDHKEIFEQISNILSQLEEQL